MDTDRALDLLRERLTELGELPPEYGTPEFSEWHQKTERTLKRIFDPDHDFVGQFSDIGFLSQSMSDDPSAERRAFGRGRTRAVALLKGAIYELEVLSEPTQFASAASVDPELWEHVRRQVESEQWALVASQTMIFVESKVRQWAGLPESKYGKELMVAVLRPGGGLFPLGTEAERKAFGDPSEVFPSRQAKLSQGEVMAMLDELGEAVRQVDPTAWRFAWAGDRASSLLALRPQGGP